MARRWAWFLIVASELDKLGGILGSIFQIPNYQTVNRKLALHSSQAEKDTDTYLKNQRMSSPRLTSAHCTVLRSNAMSLSWSDTCASVWGKCMKSMKCLIR
jgi:hypothetical protein